MVTATVCISILLVFAFLFLKLCRSELQEFREFLQGIITAAIQELTFKGGRAAKANIILSILLFLAFVFVTLTDVLSDVREFLDGPQDHQSGVKYLLFGSIFLFFLISLCFVFALDRYPKKMRD